jgi:glycosyltransferase involved in cell wall biosynthesis
MREALRAEFDRYNLRCDLDPANPLWKAVLEDCADADLLLVNSDFVKRTFVQQGYPQEKIAVAYLGVKESFFQLKRDYSIRGAVNLLFTGTFDLRKGVGLLLEAVRQLRSKHSNVRLTAIGKMGSGRVCIRPGDEVFLSWKPVVPQAEIAVALAHCDLFVFPTLAEGCSRSAMEALAAGIPVVTTLNCGLPEPNGRRTAFYVSPGDARAVADAIEALSADQDLRETMGNAGASLVLQNYSWEQYALELLRVFSGLVGVDK